MTGEIVKHSVSISGHRTSISLEKEFWDLFCLIADEEEISINALIVKIDQNRTGNLSSGVRLYVLETLLSRLTD
ncbi:MAG: ribbon-helix-helix domain-containing protein [Sneathiella sp.]